MFICNLLFSFSATVMQQFVSTFYSDTLVKPAYHATFVNIHMTDDNGCFATCCVSKVRPIRKLPASLRFSSRMSKIHRKWYILKFLENVFVYFFDENAYFRHKSALESGRKLKLFWGVLQTFI